MDPTEPSNTRELPLAVWYPMTMEPEIGEPIMFCSLGCINYYAELYGATGVNISVPNEVTFGSYIGNGLAEVLPGKPPMKIGVWTPNPLFFLESSIRTLLITKQKVKKV